MTRAVLSVGSNVGDRLAHLQSAVDGLGPLVRAVSPVFETAPWGPIDQDDYLNAIILVEDDDAGPDTTAGSGAADAADADDAADAGTDAAPDHAGVDAADASVHTEVAVARAGAWLRRAHRLEQAVGRTRTVRYGPRTLDVDVVTVDGVRSDDPRLTLPHPRAHERAFVLVPWLAVSPQAVLIGRARVADLVAGFTVQQTAGVRRRDDLALTLPTPPPTVRPAPLPTAPPAGPRARTPGAARDEPAR